MGMAEKSIYGCQGVQQVHAEGVVGKAVRHVYFHPRRVNGNLVHVDH